jgi:hypothetical protein
MVRHNSRTTAWFRSEISNCRPAKRPQGGNSLINHRKHFHELGLTSIPQLRVGINLKDTASSNQNMSIVSDEA